MAQPGTVAPSVFETVMARLRERYGLPSAPAGYAGTPSAPAAPTTPLSPGYNFKPERPPQPSPPLAPTTAGQAPSENVPGNPSAPQYSQASALPTPQQGVQPFLPSPEEVAQAERITALAMGGQQPPGSPAAPMGSVPGNPNAPQYGQAPQLQTIPLPRYVPHPTRYRGSSGPEPKKGAIPGRGSPGGQPQPVKGKGAPAKAPPEKPSKTPKTPQQYKGQQVQADEISKRNEAAAKRNGKGKKGAATTASKAPPEKPLGKPQAVTPLASGSTAGMPAIPPQGLSTDAKGRWAKEWVERRRQWPTPGGPGDR